MEEPVLFDSAASCFLNAKSVDMGQWSLWLKLHAQLKESLTRSSTLVTRIRMPVVTIFSSWEQPLPSKADAMVPDTSAHRKSLGYPLLELRLSQNHGTGPIPSSRFRFRRIDRPTLLWSLIQAHLKGPKPGPSMDNSDSFSFQASRLLRGDWAMTRAMLRAI